MYFSQFRCTFPVKWHIDCNVEIAYICHSYKKNTPSCCHSVGLNVAERCVLFAAEGRFVFERQERSHAFRRAQYMLCDLRSVSSSP